ncbi:50S ribosomal protein L25 [Dolichospermum sp. ST_sed1]|jgi:large subunit ribosomal protein L25|nr:50S ribosomal protein L25 [Dolichospermum sp. ST_sed1]MDD1427571.1 50S ribosomal protein L25 [Dolichospermum sp. ST_sed9]MDD1432064.1 50S ribosomal protein L25 [Dolichospermum sp. ST_sed6]MDD1436106.1 50S ribosomal protein L25 [Dolichospermum sp. ST_sed10]MDD1441017.1 50S ribosomal protein L25 [Dolichospermum sp. ST_sed3]MDD1447515.1 50S ribosomal protein L25 [Dolichospermum sp. ST_sed8]MDD1455354.1 50S ribosomal protein L25 [Dolichospermum sp. ST_sed7]MDD1460973.1 50S ribosomal protein L
MAITLESKTRPEGSKPRALRRSGLIPANLYGHKGIESISLVLDAKVVERLLKQVTANKTEIELSIPELEWTGTTVLREIQIHPAKGTPYHLSFFAGTKG